MRFLIVCLCLVTPAFAQGISPELARSQAPFGIQPDTDSFSHEAREVWDGYGLYLEEFDQRAFVAGLRDGSPAAQAGIKVGDAVDGTSLSGSARSLVATLRDLSITLRDGGTGRLAFYTVPFEARESFQLAPDQGSDRFRRVDVPPALRAAMEVPGFNALMRTNRRADRAEVARAGMDVLWALSHPEGCVAANAVRLNVVSTMTTVTRNGRGQELRREQSQQPNTLYVRPEFADWARANISYYPRFVSKTARTVLDAIRLEGCDGVSVATVTKALASWVGVSLPNQPPQPAPSNGIPDDATAFLASCFPAMQKVMGRRSLDRTVVSNCFCQEHAARQLGQPAIYDAAAQATGNDLYAQLPREDRMSLDRAFNACARAPLDSPMRQQLEALWDRLQL